MTVWGKNRTRPHLATSSVRTELEDAAFTEQVLAIVRRTRRPTDCRDIAELHTGSMRLTIAEAHRLVKETPGSLHLMVASERVNVVAADDGSTRYVRTMATDSGDDPLLDLPESADR